MIYAAPEVEVIEVEVERGFAASPGDDTATGGGFGDGGED